MSPHSANIYEVFLRAYRQKDRFLALIADLPRIKALGINYLWLMPIYPIGEKNRKGSLGSPYAIKDYYAVDPLLGKPENLKELVKKSHSLGLGVILDLVLNHTARDNVLLSTYPQFYKRKKSEFYTVNPDWSDVYDLDYAKKTTRDYIIKMLSFWLKEYDLDGFRCDVAELVPIDFWLEAWEKIKKIKPDLLLLAEGNQAFLYPAFNLTYDEDSYFALKRVLKGEGESRAAEIAEILDYQLKNFPPGFAKMRFIENHDQVRIASLVKSRAELEKLIVYYLLLEGAALIYNGQEYGLKEWPDILNPFTIPWEKGEQKVLELYLKYLKLRNSSPLFLSGELKILPSPSPDLLCYRRSNQQEWAMLAVNFGKKPAVLKIKTENPEISSLEGEIGEAKTVKLNFMQGKAQVKIDQFLLLRSSARTKISLT